jgi:hypothetical protein
MQARNPCIQELASHSLWASLIDSRILEGLGMGGG